MLFKKFEITSIHNFALEFRTRGQLRDTGFYYHNVKLFSLTLIFKSFTILIEV